MESDNFFDDLMADIDTVEVIKQQKDAESKAARLDYLIHQVFYQNEHGAELLDIWGDTLIMTPTASPGDDSISIGISEGYKRFIRGILLTIKRVNDGR